MVRRLTSWSTPTDLAPLLVPCESRGGLPRATGCVNCVAGSGTRRENVLFHHSRNKNVSRSWQAHRTKKFQQSQQRHARRAAQQKNSGASGGAGAPAPRQGGNSQGNSTQSGTQHQGGNQRGALRIPFPNTIPQPGPSHQRNTNRNVRARSDSGGYLNNPTEAHLDEALAAFEQHGASGSRFQDVTDDDYYHSGHSGHLSFPTCDALEPQRIALPIVLLLAITGLLTSQVTAADDDLTLGLATIALPVAFCLYLLVPHFVGSATLHPAATQAPPAAALPCYCLASHGPDHYTHRSDHLPALQPGCRHRQHIASLHDFTRTSFSSLCRHRLLQDGFLQR